MRLALLVALLSGCTQAEGAGALPSPGGKADIFGVDDRLEVYELEPGSPLEPVVEATALVLDRSDLVQSGEGSWSLPGARTLGEEWGLCEDVRFAEQPIAGFCTGVLVGPDLLLTAGHCVVLPEDCHDLSVVFGHEYGAPPGDPRSISEAIPAEDVYHCEEAVDIAFAWATWDECEVDYALLRLDRPVVDRAPLDVAAPPEIAVGDELAAVGHSSNLPKKVSPAGALQSFAHQGQNLYYDLDTFSGNSGSPVVDASGALQALHICAPIRGDYAPAEESCRRPSECVAGECDGWGVGFRTGPLAPLVDCAREGVAAADCEGFEGYPDFEYDPPDGPHP